MISTLMEQLGEALYSSTAAALAASFLWGLMSMMLSPCHLVSVPLVMGYLESGKPGGTRGEKLLQALIFAFGMTVSIAVIGVVTGLLGRIIGDIGGTGNIVLAVVLVYVGISITGLWELPLPGRRHEHRTEKRGAFGALVLGLILGAALGPCTFAFMAPVLALMFSMGSENLGFAVQTGLMFALGHGMVVVLAGTFSDRLSRLLKWSGGSTSRVFRVVCGLLVVFGGFYLFMKAF